MESGVVGWGGITRSPPPFNLQAPPARQPGPLKESSLRTFPRGLQHPGTRALLCLVYLLERFFFPGPLHNSLPRVTSNPTPGRWIWDPDPDFTARSLLSFQELKQFWPLSLHLPFSLLAFSFSLFFFPFPPSPLKFYLCLLSFLSFSCLSGFCFIQPFSILKAPLHVFQPLKGPPASLPSPTDRACSGRRVGKGELQTEAQGPLWPTAQERYLLGPPCIYLSSHFLTHTPACSRFSPIIFLTRYM